MREMVYLDYAATTPVDPKVIREMVRFLGPDGAFGNPASRTHRYGKEAEEAVEKSRQEVASLINARPEEIIWTSGATESDNLAIKGIAYSYADRGNHIITSEIEHKAVLDSCRFLESQGFEVTYIRPDARGLITPEKVESCLRPNTILVSLMQVNNEIGTITNIGDIAEITRRHNVILHTDAAQSAARLKLDVQIVNADLVSLSGHKIYGPKGIGALYVRRNSRIRLQAQIHGGGHEQGMRSGTLPTHQIVGMGEAARLARIQHDADKARIESLSDCLLNQLNRIEQVTINGSCTYRVPGIVNVRFSCVESESLILMLKDIAVSTGSACTSSSIEPSYVLTSLGLDEDASHSSIRISIGRFTTQEEVDYSAKQITNAVRELRALSPVWAKLFCHRRNP